MTTLEEVAIMFADLEAEELVGWIEQRWVQPESMHDGGWAFHEIDVARVQLIYDLRRDLGMPEDTVPLVLSLLDQVYELRCSLDMFGRVLADQPPLVQAAFQTALAERRLEK